MQALNKILKHTDLMLGAGLLIMVAMLILPLPHWVLDTGLVIAIGSSVIILLASVNVDDPLKFSVFPSMLLITTLFRLALSIAATKLILGSGEAGSVIETFGNFVMGGDFVVGFVAFMILMIVQFIVITNGAGRVSEVTARFTLDAMPGKQMAIDADLAAGLIDEHQARERRKAVKQEADFFGAMDGASKFVKGDAIASILIIVINIVGGFAVGFFRGEGDAIQILQTYALLSVGEGLVSQIPALLISTASGLLVTRAGQERHMGGELVSQILAQPRALASAGGALCAFAFIPGFPALIFLAAGGSLLGLYKLANNNQLGIKNLLRTDAEKKAQADAVVQAAPAINPGSAEAILPTLQVDALEFEIGFGLTPLADPKSGGDLPDRIGATRRQIATELGFIMPSVRIRDNVVLNHNDYVIKVRGEMVAKASVEADRLLAIGSGGATLIGIPCKEPVFGLDALWIDPSLRHQAELEGYTVIEPTAMMSTHLAEIAKMHAAELLSRQEVTQLIENAKGVNPTVIEELIPGTMSIGDVQKVLQHLLRERVPIRDMVLILETLADFAPRVKDHDQLGELVRASINRTITRQFVGDEAKLHCLTLEPALERALVESVQNTAVGAVLAVDPSMQQSIMDQLNTQADVALAQGYNPVLLCNNTLRLPLSRVVQRWVPSLHVLAYNEVAASADVEIIGAIAMPAVAA